MSSIIIVLVVFGLAVFIEIALAWWMTRNGC